MKDRAGDTTYTTSDAQQTLNKSPWRKQRSGLWILNNMKM